jgi:hypothetical protein
MASTGSFSEPDGEPEPVAERVEILADADRPGGWMLLLERIRQSYVDLDDPTYLDFEYMRWMAHVVDAAPDGPLAVTHLGAGAATLVRYIAATRPGSSQIVCEPDAELTQFVRSKLPFRRDVRVRIRAIDGRSGIAALGNASADLVVLDAFAGGRVPAELGTAEFVAEVSRVLRLGGLFVANIGDGGTLTYARRFVAAMGTRFPHALLVTDKSVLNGRRYGNIMVAGSGRPLPMEPIRRGLLGEPFQVQVLAGRELTRWLGGAAPFTDADAQRSPSPPEETWRVAPD